MLEQNRERCFLRDYDPRAKTPNSLVKIVTDLCGAPFLNDPLT
jgi:hypothetical protein